MVHIYIILFYVKENILVSARIFVVSLFYMQILRLTLLRDEIGRKEIKRLDRRRETEKEEDLTRGSEWKVLFEARRAIIL